MDTVALARKLQKRSQKEVDTLEQTVEGKLKSTGYGLYRDLKKVTGYMHVWHFPVSECYAQKH